MNINTMAYGTDTFNFRRQSLFKSAFPFDFADETSITGFNIGGTEPAGTLRRVVFEIDGQLYKFGSSGLTLYEGRGELDDILAEGNSVAEILAVDNVPEFVGKQVYVLCALDAPSDAPIMPKFKIAAKVNCFNDVYTKTEYSPIYVLREGAKISEVRTSADTNGHATATIYCRIFDAVANSWQDWTYAANIKNVNAAKIQFKVNYILTTLDGSDFARVNYIKCFYITDAEKIAAPCRNFITAAQNFDSDLKTCYVLVKHSELIDSQISAYVNFSDSLIRRQNIMLGITTGLEQTVYLQNAGIVDKNVAQDSIHIDINGKTFSDFYFDTENSTITLTAPAGYEIYASYDCGIDNELWREMDFDYSKNDGNYFSSRFTYRANDNSSKKVTAVKISVTTLSGSVETVEIGTGNGSVQNFALEHRAKPETLYCNCPYKYIDAGQMLQTAAPADSPVAVRYDWRAIEPTIFEIICGWSV